MLWHRHPVLQQQRVKLYPDIRRFPARYSGRGFPETLFPDAGVWVSDTRENHVRYLPGRDSKWYLPT